VYDWLEYKIIDVIMIIFQTIFISMNFSYIFQGIRDRMENRLKWMMLIFFILMFLDNRTRLLKEISVLTITAVMIIYYWICYWNGKMNGDNKNTQDAVDYDYFNYVNKAMLGIKVLFPLDIGNNKKNRKEGVIRKIGKAASGKYSGDIVCLIESENQFYLCPVKKIYPVEALKEQDDSILAHTENTVIKLLNWESDWCKGYFSVVAI
jgi:Ca2+/Na+ antiporter